MGRDSHFTCKTCKKTYDLGYSSYGSWLDNLSKQEYENIETSDKELLVNQNYYRCLVEHNGHDVVVWSSDWGDIRNGNLEIEVYYGRNKVLCYGIGEFEEFDLEG